MTVFRIENPRHRTRKIPKISVTGDSLGIETESGKP
jgi:hypothetical protein